MKLWNINKFPITMYILKISHYDVLWKILATYAAGAQLGRCKLWAKGCKQCLHGICVWAWRKACNCVYVQLNFVWGLASPFYWDDCLVSSTCFVIGIVINPWFLKHSTCRYNMQCIVHAGCAKIDQHFLCVCTCSCVHQCLACYACGSCYILPKV